MKTFELKQQKKLLEDNMEIAFQKLKRFKEEFPQMRDGNSYDCPGAWLNAYRECDITYAEAVALIENYKGERQ